MEGPKYENNPRSQEPAAEDNNPESREGHSQLPVEEVISHLGEALESCRSNPHQNTNHGEILHREIEHTEISELFHSYEKHKIVSLQDITDSIRVIASKLENIKAEIEDDPEEMNFVNTKFNLLRKRDIEITASVRRYVGSVAQFQSIKKQQLRMLPEEYRDKLVEIDSRRRKAHDSLIDTLSIYTRLINELKNGGYLDDINVFQWDFSHNAADFKVSESSIAIFSERILKDRDLIKDWAITAHMYQSLKIIEELEKGPESNDAPGTL